MLKSGRALPNELGSESIGASLADAVCSLRAGEHRPQWKFGVSVWQEPMILLKLFGQLQSSAGRSAQLLELNYSNSNSRTISRFRAALDGGGSRKARGLRFRCFHPDANCNGALARKRESSILGLSSNWNSNRNSVRSPERSSVRQMESQSELQLAILFDRTANWQAAVKQLLNETKKNQIEKYLN